MATDLKSIVLKSRTRLLKSVALGGLIAILGIGLATTNLGLKLEEEVGLSWLFGVRGATEPPSDIYIVNMDRASAAILGQPPKPRDWSRQIHATLIDRLVRHGVSTIVFDMFFETPREPKDEENLAAAIARSQRVVLVQRIEREETTNVRIDRLISPHGELGLAPIGLGPFPLPKIPNRVSQFWTFYQTADNTPTLPVVALQIHALNTAGETLFRKIVEQAGLVTADEPPESIRTAEDTRQLMAQLRQTFEEDPLFLQRFLNILERKNGHPVHAVSTRALRALAYAYSARASEFLNFYGFSGTIPTIPYSAFWKGEDSPTALPNLENAIVFVGRVTESPSDQEDGFFTVFTTEGGLDLGGVEIAATALGNLLQQSHIRPLSMAWIALLLFMFGMLSGFLASMISGFRGTFVVCVLGVVYFMLVQMYFSEQQLWWPIFIPLAIQLPLAVIVGLSLHYLSASKSSESVTRAMKYYLPQRVVDQIVEQGSGSSAALEVVYATCLCSDVADYMTLSEQVTTHELIHLSNEYFSLLGDRISNHDGDILDIVGDGMTCTWSAAEPEANVRRQACLAAVEILEDVRQFNLRHPDRRFQTRIGLNTGRVAIGNIGGGGHLSYSVIGDIVNSASRIEGLNKLLHTWLLASEAVVKDLDDLLVRRVGSFILKGKASTMIIFHILGEKQSATDTDIRLCERFDIALQLYDNRQWIEAGRSFQAVLEQFPEDGPATFYLDRCRYNASQPNPKSQSPIIRLDTK